MLNSPDKTNPEIVIEVPEYLVMRLENSDESLSFLSTMPLESYIIRKNLPAAIEAPYPKPIGIDKPKIIFHLENSSRVNTMKPIGSPIEFLHALEDGSARNLLPVSDVTVFRSLIKAAEGQDSLDIMTNQVLFSIYEGLVNQNNNKGIYRSFTEEKIRKLLFGELLDIPSDAKFRVKRVEYNDTVYEGADLGSLQENLRETSNQNILKSGLSQLVLSPGDGKYFYRMPRKEEWDTIRNNEGLWLVRGGTNVETEENFNSAESSFIDVFANDDEYSGAPIRFKPPLLAYNKVASGGSVFGRAFLPHFVKVEYFDKDKRKWVDFKGKK